MAGTYISRETSHQIMLEPLDRLLTMIVGTQTGCSWVRIGPGHASLICSCTVTVLLGSGQASPGQVRSGQVISAQSHLFLHCGCPVGVRIATLQFLSHPAPHGQGVLVAVLDPCGTAHDTRQSLCHATGQTVRVTGRVGQDMAVTERV